MGVILKNNAVSTITTAISASDVGLAVAAGTGSLFPTLGVNDYFYATLVSSGGTYEIVKVTARVGDTMTIVRAQEDTTAQSFAAGTSFEARVTAASIRDTATDVVLTRLGSTATGNGASLVGVHDAGNYYAATTVEGVLQELGASGGTVGINAIVDNFTGNGSAVNFTLSKAPVSQNTIDVFINGVYQNKTDFSFAGTTLTFTQAPPLGSEIEVCINTNALAGTVMASNVSYNQGGTGAVQQTVQTKLEQYVSVKDFGAVGDGIVDDTAAIQAAVATGETIYFPSGKYRITATIDGYASEGGWIGDGSGPVFDSAWAPGCTMLLLDGTNAGAAFLKPPKVFRGFHIDGQSSNNIGVQLGQNGAFTGFQIWENLHVRRCDIAFDTYNFFCVNFRDIAVQGNMRGFRMTPSDTPSDDGYWTATNWTNIYIADNQIYGLLAEAPFGTRTWVWSNVVIERNGASGTYQARMKNINVEVHGGFFEGSSTIPVLEMESVTMSITNGFFNGTGGIDFTSNNATLSLDQVTFTSATDVFSNVNNNVKIYAKNSSIQSDVRDYAAVFELYNTTTAGVQVPKLVSGITIGRPNIDGIQPRSISRVVTYRKSITATINAGATVEVITNQYYYGLWSDATIAVASLQYYNQGLVCEVTPANNTSSPHYFCVEITNTTAAPITITAKNLSVFVFTSDDFIQL